MKIKRQIFSLLFLLGCSSVMVPEYEGPVSDHYNGKQFFNTEPTEDKSLWTVLKWRFNRERVAWPENVPVKVGEKPPTVTEGIRLTFVNHSTDLVQTSGINFLIDPIWSERAGPTSWLGQLRHHIPGLNFKDLPKIDFVIISHNHYDHLDLPTLQNLRDQSNPMLFAGLGTKSFFKQNGLEHAVNLDWWQAYPWSEKVTVHGVPARHWSMRSWGNRRQVLWLSFVIETSRGRIFYAGDTGWGGHFENIKKRYGEMEVCIFPIGAYLPRWFMQDNHINPEEAVRAHKLLSCKKSLGVHFGTFQQSDEQYGQPEKDLFQAMKIHGVPDEDFRTLKPGEHWEL